MNRDIVLQSIMGKEMFESLNKALVKLNTKSVVDIAELHSAMKTVPKSIMAFLMRELKDMKKDETREIKLPWADNSMMVITKMDSDVYKGKMIRDSKVAHEFDLTAIPQLAAHLMSTFEIYDEDQAGGGDGGEGSSKASESNNDLKEQVKALDSKINALMMLIASQQMTKNVEMAKTEIKKSDANKFEKFCKSYRNLQKGGLAPKMPSPPRPGTKVGGNAGITQAGFHGPKTEHSDSNKHPRTQLENPYLKAPKSAGDTKGSKPKASGQGTTSATAAVTSSTAKSEKTLTVAKSELHNKCIDCGQGVGDCACFKALSKPEIKKSDSNNITFKFKSDWDSEAVEALYKSIKRRREQMDEIVVAFGIQNPNLPSDNVEAIAEYHKQFEYARRLIFSLISSRGGRIIGQLGGDEIVTLPADQAGVIKEIHRRLWEEHHIPASIGVGEDSEQALLALDTAQEKDPGTIKVFNPEMEQSQEELKPLDVAVGERDQVAKSQRYIPISQEDKQQIASILQSVQQNKQVFDQLMQQAPEVYAGIVSVIQSLTTIIQEDKKAQEEHIAKMIEKINTHLGRHTEKTKIQHTKDIQKEIDRHAGHADQKQEDARKAMFEAQSVRRKQSKEDAKEHAAATGTDHKFMFNLLRAFGK